MNLYSFFILILFVSVSLTSAVTSPITEMGLRAYHANVQYQTARQKLFKAGYHRPTQSHRMKEGSALSFANLLKQIKQAQKIVAKRRKMEKLFNKMVQITNEYKS